jgi:arsenate reductase
MPLNKKKILFVCTHNSARSQVAEGLLNHYYGDRLEAFSGGTEVTRVRPEAIKVMAEIGIDISRHRSKKAADFLGKPFDLVITVCDSAQESCPFFPGARNYLHKSFSDPAKVSGSEEKRLAVFRQIRDEIKNWIDKELVSQICLLK